MRRPVIIASILLLALACDKPNEAELPPPVPLTDMSTASAVLFTVYGARDEPRAAPIAIIANGALQPIVLDNDGWRTFDSTYFGAGARLPIYRDGADVGAVEVSRGMWMDGVDALYALPACREVVPQAEVRLQATITPEESVEFLASSVPLPQKKKADPLPRDASAPGRTIANAVATAGGVGREELQSLDFIGRWLSTGAGPSGRTLLGSYIDPNAGDAGPGAGHTTMILALAEDSAGTQNTSYSHLANGEARAVDFQRVANHVDLDGDGVDEIIVEQWRYAATPDLIVLKYGAGKWSEVFRMGLGWCVRRTDDGR
ncbi:MAG: hypothetical protein KJZ74_09845 [Gemmatimonadales bacterium]|nr:hypothetical protein [Gemmatimonadota bacterium]MCL4214208.1 hypothetical protein [Gemmatimonadales bacterium]